MTKKCILCGGKLVFKKTQFHNYSLNCWKCEKCGEELLNPRQTQAILESLKFDESKPEIKHKYYCRYAIPFFLLSFTLGLALGLTTDSKFIINLNTSSTAGRPCIGIYCPQKNPLWNDSTTFFYDNVSGFYSANVSWCPNNLASKEIVCDCAKPESEYYKKHHAFCMALCFECL